MLAKAKTRPSKNSVIKATGRTCQVIHLNSLDRETDSVCYHSKHVKIEGKNTSFFKFGPNPKRSQIIRET